MSLLSYASLLFVFTTYNCPCISGQGYQGSGNLPLIEITVSPLVTNSTLRILDISWNVYNSWNAKDWVSLYGEPPQSKSQASFFTGPVASSKGWIRTGISENRSTSVEPDFKKKCLGYWAAYWKESQIDPVATTCLSDNPTWMTDNWESIKHLKLSQIFLPGTHNSGSYKLIHSPSDISIFDKYVHTQDEPILEQLIHGARYLDFRIGRYNRVKTFIDLILRPSEYDFWLNHDFVQVNKLEAALKDVNLFLNNTEEIVIIDIHAFPVGFKRRSESHMELIKYLNLTMGHHLTSYMSYEATLEDVRKTGKRLIVAYNRPSILHLYPGSLWRPISQKWGDVRTVEDLHSYIVRTMAKPHLSGMFAIMAELTPSSWDVFTDEQKGLRTMMDNCNHNVTEWFRDDFGLTVNAVAVDFIRSTGIVTAAINWNKEKAKRLFQTPP